MVNGGGRITYSKFVIKGKNGIYFTVSIFSA